MPDPDDNPDNHVVTNHEAGASISFEALNAGDAGGNARAGTELDDIFVTEGGSQYLDSGQSEVGYVSLGCLNEGRHAALIYVNPGSEETDHSANTFDVRVSSYAATCL